ncbi:hypothetical protein MA16_Dca020890 [Dendrobium catenatum]|uniref:Uncharacterized protein n=1 Tax=Dendrobium catenatum TaxID=906689 RepID=A0A2I0VN29_9ASPA|nr:hypothetical protein MA16_Dca020890 [Dendrobium catenatum]
MGQSLSSCCFESVLINMELGDGAPPCKLKPMMLEKPVKAEGEKPVAMMVPIFPVLSRLNDIHRRGTSLLGYAHHTLNCNLLTIGHTIVEAGNFRDPSIDSCQGVNWIYIDEVEHGGSFHGVEAEQAKGVVIIEGVGPVAELRLITTKLGFWVISG